MKLKSKHIRGTLTKKKKRKQADMGVICFCNIAVFFWKLLFKSIETGDMVGIVHDVYRDLPSWLGRESLAGGTKEKCYFGLETTGGVIQFECMNKIFHRICTEGVAQLLSLAQSERSRLQRMIPLS